MRIFDTADLTPDSRLGPDATSWVYNGIDCGVTHEVYGKLTKNLDNQSSATYALERNLQGPILDMNLHGILVDGEELRAAKEFLTCTIARLELQLERLLKEGYGVELNWRSNQQLIWFFYENLRLPTQRKRKQDGSFGPTVERNAIETLEGYLIARPICLHLLLLRDLAKKLSFLNTEIDPDGFLRSAYNIAGTVTGRLSSAGSYFGTGANNQNIDRLLRRIFIAPKGKKFGSIDLSQADSRNVGANCWNKFYHSHGASFAGAYLDACESSDLHTFVTHMGWQELAWGNDERKFRAIADTNAYRDYTYRDLAKRLGHGTNYYGKPPTMAKHTKIPVEIATNFQSNYFAAFPCIREGHLWTAARLKDEANLSTLLGFRRYFFGRLDDDTTLRDAIAFEGQGSTAGQINLGMLAIWRGGRRFPGFQLLQQVHDNIMFEYDEVCEDEIIPWALDAIEVPIQLEGGREFRVPGEAKVGWNGGDFNDDPKRRANPDGLKKWKGQDSRTRLIGPQAKFALR